MPSIIAAYLPGYFLATNSGTDGYLRSVVASRYTIARSQKWLDGVSLIPFGYSNSPSTFTRDLFEAEIIVPGWTQPLHVFTTHLKATESGANYTNSVRRRAAEASAVSNFFVMDFLPAHAQQPYVLTGDLNEDIDKPKSAGGHPIERLISPPTGLRLTTPLNPATAGSNTYTIRGSLNERIDYILPCGLLFSNIAGSQVFRTDKLSPMPPNLFTNDSATASDHLPVIMSFHNPYDPAPRITTVTASNQFLHLTWQSVTGRTYRVETSTNCANWSAAGSNLLATATNQSWSIPRAGLRQFLRVQRLP
jgi:endonuclease/exonuclease/phosphatase family metal-dependent hydrolase